MGTLRNQAKVHLISGGILEGTVVLESYGVDINNTAQKGQVDIIDFTIPWSQVRLIEYG